jgi:hypothetical protein
MGATVLMMLGERTLASIREEIRSGFVGGLGNGDLQASALEAMAMVDQISETCYGNE